jgi:hypothetical protein
VCSGYNIESVGKKTDGEVGVVNSRPIVRPLNLTNTFIPLYRFKSRLQEEDPPGQVGRLIHRRILSRTKLQIQFQSEALVTVLSKSHIKVIASIPTTLSFSK